ncbi:sporulation transcriptional regulator SpoIIID, partial [Dysosmobacter welbionis]
RSVPLNDNNRLRNAIVQLHASEGFELLLHIAFTIGAAGSGLVSRLCGGLCHGLSLTVEPAVRDGMLPGVQHSFLFAHTVSFQH